jgi:hypothetical protein
MGAGMLASGLLQNQQLMSQAILALQQRGITIGNVQQLQQQQQQQQQQPQPRAEDNRENEKERKRNRWA